MKPEKFSLGISGEGHLIPPFLQSLKAECPAVIIYDRNKEQNRPPPDVPIPRHPKVSDVDAFFALSGGNETATIRSGKGHRFFSYVKDPDQTEPVARALLIRRMVCSVQDLV